MLHKKYDKRGKLAEEHLLTNEGSSVLSDQEANAPRRWRHSVLKIAAACSSESSTIRKFAIFRYARFRGSINQRCTNAF